MALPQKKLRELVFQFLFSYNLGKPEEKELILLMMQELSVSKKNAYFAWEKVSDLLKVQDQIDSLIDSVSDTYSFDRIHSVEKNVLRLGVYEMRFDESIPEKVAISEAIRLTKKFSTPESISFVNAILDKLLTDIKILA